MTAAAKSGNVIAKYLPVYFVLLGIAGLEVFLAYQNFSTVTLLVINDDLCRVFYFRRRAAIPLPGPAALVQRSAHLLHRDLRMVHPTFVWVKTMGRLT